MILNARFGVSVYATTSNLKTRSCYANGGVLQELGVESVSEEKQKSMYCAICIFVTWGKKKLECLHVCICCVCATVLAICVREKFGWISRWWIVLFVF